MTARRRLPIFLMLGFGPALLTSLPVLAGQPKVSICHNGHTITVAAPAARAHLRHGDHRGACGGAGTTVVETEQRRETTVISEPAVTEITTTVIHDYLFYPDANVYFDASRELYFYQDNGQWLEQHSLPDALRASLGEFITLNRQAASPASFHDEVVATLAPAAIATDAPPWQQGEGETVSYLYYPSVGAYYDTERALYHYRHEDRWLTTPTLIQELRQGLDQFVTLDMRTTDPYEYHDAIAASYGGPTLTEATAGLLTQTVDQVLDNIGTGAFRYRYYPDNDLYYDEVRQVYFHQQGEQWVTTPTLPETLGNALGAFLSVTLDTAEPYQRHQTVVDAFRSGAVVTRTSSYQYQYFPGTNVYYESDAGRYHYLAEGVWQTAESLPQGLSVDLDAGTTLDFATEQPYLYHRQVIRQFAPAVSGVALGAVSVRETLGGGNVQQSIQVKAREAAGARVQLKSQSRTKVKVKAKSRVKRKVAAGGGGKGRGRGRGKGK